MDPVFISTSIFLIQLASACLLVFFFYAYLSPVDCSTTVPSGKRRSFDSTRSFEGDDDSFLYDMILCTFEGDASITEACCVSRIPISLTITQIPYRSTKQNEVRRCRHPCSCLLGFGLCPCSLCQRKFLDTIEAANGVKNH